MIQNTIPIRTQVVESAEGTKRLTVKKPAATHYDLQNGDIVWVEIKCIIRGKNANNANN